MRQGGADRAVQALWSGWGAAAVTTRQVPLGDEDVRGFLRGIAAAAGAREAVLTFHPQGDQPRATAVADAEALLSAKAHQDLADEAGPLLAGAAWGAPVSPSDWAVLALDLRNWHVLRLAVASRRAGSSAVLNLLFEAATPASRLPEAAQIAALRPLVDSYLRLWQRARSRERIAAGLHCALDSMDLGIVLVDRQARIVFANGAAQGFLANEEHIRRAGTGLAASDLRQGVSLQVALTHAIASNVALPEATVRPRRAPALALRSTVTQRPLILNVVPAAEPASEPHDVAAIVYLLDPKLDTAVQIEPACRLYGLTPVETRLVAQLVAGHTLQESAEAIRVKEQTARSYLKQIFLKTNTNRQANLVRVMLSSLMPTQRDIEPAFLN